MNEWINEWLNEWMNMWVGKWMNEWMNEQTNEWMNEFSYIFYLQNSVWGIYFLCCKKLTFILFLLDAKRFLWGPIMTWLICLWGLWGGALKGDSVSARYIEVLIMIGMCETNVFYFTEKCNNDGFFDCF